MNQTHKLILGIVALSFAALSACKKSTTTSTSSMLIGTWTFQKQYNDNNNNGIMDANELDTTGSGAGNTLKFNSDGTAVTSIMNVPFMMSKWQLVDNNTYLKLTDTTSTPSDTYLHIETLTSTTLELKDTSHVNSAETSWTFFTKQ